MEKRHNTVLSMVALNTLNNMLTICVHLDEMLSMLLLGIHQFKITAVNACVHAQLT